MKKLSLYIVLIQVIGFLSGCDRCKDLSYCHYLPEIDKYFGMYVPGNWWVYYNQDSTKIDSIYVINFEETIQKDFLEECSEFPQREFELFSNYISTTAEPVKGLYLVNANCSTNYLSFKTLGWFLGVSMNSDIDDHPISQDEVILDSIIINGIVYQEVIYFPGSNANLYLGANKGIIAYINNSDTFSLIKYFIQ